MRIIECINPQIQEVLILEETDSDLDFQSLLVSHKFTNIYIPANMYASAEWLRIKSLLVRVTEEYYDDIFIIYKS